MQYEKSCGSVIYRIDKDFRVLIIKQARNSNWSFPKGHIENGETETDTAVREVREEVGLSVNPLDGFRRVISYTPKPKTEKDVVYFVSDSGKQHVRLQREEVSDYKWLYPEQAFDMLTFQNDKEVLKAALDFLKEKGILK